MPSKILIVDDEPFNLDLLEQELTDLGYAIARANDGAQALAAIEKVTPDLVLLDYLMPGMNGIQVLHAVRKIDKDLPIVMITAHGSIELAVEAVKAGADDFITKPFDPEHLALVVKKNLERANLKSDVEFFARELGGRHRLIAGDSEAMRQIMTEARKAAASKATVLLLGESGTGKELVARSIHKWSERRLKPFVAINCAGLAKELLESELFGHEKGAFTGAHQLKKGKLELAHDGTVFLDEIGDLALELQTKLLRALQEREFERVGGTAPIAVDLRIIAATNRDLEGAVKNGAFREDLYHRLNVIALTLPPLRDRKEDIPALASYFLERFAAETKKGFSAITEEALDKLIAYHWPGNIRELANVIERAVVLGDGPDLTVHHLPTRVVGTRTAAVSNEASYHDAINSYRREIIVRALADAQGNRAAAAKTLGLHRTHLMKLLKALRIS
ncbi:MAG TPA: sigma-54 dependent transcriptional regulator [Terriglobales bacterium]|jgi:DNA-binding NtrC family response regulator|nr:sigma-54 dependent transcriptional regulator [Terriglobales bacterium]